MIDERAGETERLKRRRIALFMHPAAPRSAGITALWVINKDERCICMLFRVDLSFKHIGKTILEVLYFCNRHLYDYTIQVTSQEIYR